MTKADLSKTLKRLTGAGILLALVVLTVSILIPLPQELFAPVSVVSVRVEDRRGIPLRTLLNDEQGRGVWKPLHEIAPEMRLAVVAIEDHRFRSHVGIDPLSVARAVWTNLISFRVRSGGSTLTQQVARRIVPIPR
ncbi:MAG: transglycosylase domain-containing protein, partial [Bacteroidetes bacterium]|nr:transglycosylase domain-containing protein [Bacteroidota bacterium]